MSNVVRFPGLITEGLGEAVLSHPAVRSQARKQALAVATAQRERDLALLSSLVFDVTIDTDMLQSIIDRLRDSPLVEP